MSNILMEALRALREDKELKEEQRRELDYKVASNDIYSLVEKNIFNPRNLTQIDLCIVTETDADGREYEVAVHIFEGDKDKAINLKNEFDNTSKMIAADLPEKLPDGWALMGLAQDYKEIDYNNPEDLYNIKNYIDTAEEGEFCSGIAFYSRIIYTPYDDEDINFRF